MLSIKSVVLLAQCISAFPQILNQANLAKRQNSCSVSSACDTPVEISDQDAGTGAYAGPLASLSSSRTNCGEQGTCTTFNAAKQYVSNTGDHAFIAPGPNDIRGPCPGLNAAANHGYLPRNGIATQAQTISGLHDLYGMGPDLSEFLAAYAVIFDGDLISKTWSIGGPPPNAGTLSGVLGKVQGISYSHNKYEGDTSISRCDAYLNGGNAHTSSMTRFNYAWEQGMANDRYTLDAFSQNYAKNSLRSIRTNPMFFAPLFSTTLVSPAAYNFVINFMSNHTAEEPAGYLDGSTFKTFFSITGDYPNFKWVPGYERIPDNWYRRPEENLYTITSVFADLIPEFLAYPQSFRFGGNSNGVNTYTGIDLTNLTRGALNAEQLFQGNNLQCFLYQNLQQGLPDQLKGGINDVDKALSFISPILSKAFGDLGCPQINAYDDNTFSQYPGYYYSPVAPGGSDVC